MLLVLVVLAYGAAAAKVVVFGGQFTTAGGRNAARAAAWDPAAGWTALGSGVNDDVLALTTFNGDLIAGGEFTAAGGVAASRVARTREPMVRAMASWSIKREVPWLRRMEL